MVMMNGNWLGRARCLCWVGSLLLVALVMSMPSPRALADSAEGVSGVKPEKKATSTQPTATRSRERLAADGMDDELVRKLLNRAAGQGENEEVVQRIMRLMEASRLRLGGRFDPGDQTQKIQKRILEEMDEAIKRSRQSRSRSQQQKQQRASRSGVQRRRGQRRNGQQQKKDQQGKGQQTGAGKDAAEDEQASKGQAQSGEKGKRAAVTARSWGNLPPRDREAVLQGIKDDVLPKFRALIDRYYKALSASANER